MLRSSLVRISAVIASDKDAPSKPAWQRAVEFAKELVESNRFLRPVLTAILEFPCDSIVVGPDPAASSSHLAALLKDDQISSTLIDYLMFCLSLKIPREHGRVLPGGSLFTQSLQSNSLDPSFKKYIEYFPIRNDESQRKETAVVDCKTDAIISILHVNTNHWVPVVIDFRDKTIFTADSLASVTNHKPSKLINKYRDLQVLRDWAAEKSGINNTDFAIQCMKITRQKDLISCGVMAFNAIEHHFLPADRPLVKADKRSLRLKRLAMLFDTIHSVISIRDNENFVSIQ